MDRLPDFLVIGAARAGTTALHAYLRQHPQVFMPALKEPNVFAFEGETLNCKGPGADYINNSLTDLAAYRALFAKAPGGAICGEASPLYLFSERAAARIAHHRPDARLVVILRARRRGLGLRPRPTWGQDPPTPFFLAKIPPERSGGGSPARG